ncbi:MAG: hypothetical protein BWY09_02547 [Candidatus Hydrogenedentes bacterium ADurb.Bin179]|nr:MAG: hypothetical protein BWY09_02547 [Candidatus Hydrogenedentes bacterium ADurb.Bin179]
MGHLGGDVEHQPIARLRGALRAVFRKNFAHVGIAAMRTAAAGAENNQGRNEQHNRPRLSNAGSTYNPGNILKVWRERRSGILSLPS